MTFNHLIKILEDTGNTITLNEIYGDGLPDDDELFWNFISNNDLDTSFTIKEISPKDLHNKILYTYQVDSIEVVMSLLTKSQKRIISHYRKHINDKPIIISGDIIIDGHHRALAGLLDSRHIFYIDVDEE